VIKSRTATCVVSCVVAWCCAFFVRRHRGWYRRALVREPTVEEAQRVITSGTATDEEAQWVVPQGAGRGTHR